MRDFQTIEVNILLNIIGSSNVHNIVASDENFSQATS